MSDEEIEDAIVRAVFDYEAPLSALREWGFVITPPPVPATGEADNRG